MGATGETGKVLLQKLISDNYFENIIVISRRLIKDLDTSKVQIKVVDFHKIGDYKEYFVGVSVAFCCIGTSLTKVSKVSTYSIITLKRIQRIHKIQGFQGINKIQ